MQGDRLLCTRVNDDLTDIVNLVALGIGGTYQNVYLAVAHAVLRCHLSANLRSNQFGGRRGVQV